METSENIAHLTDVSFADFETKNSDENTRFDNYGQCQTKHDMAMTLDLSLGQKTENLFATDQTPTPTRLIKNCEEVGLFDDLQHVNPFDIGFQRAAEQNAVAGNKTLPATPARFEGPPTDGDSLHTPQVYPVEAVQVSASAPAIRQHSSPLDVPMANMEELLTTPTPSTTAPEATPIVTGPPPLHVIQPQVITWVLPAQTLPISTMTTSAISKTPKQTMRPYILPKPSKGSTAKASAGALVNSTTPVHEPSSASLTPTSQLPIKERLKAILNNSNNNNRKQRSFQTPPPKAMSKVQRNEDCMERRRAAASRYRHKMRNEHRDIKDHNAQLQQEIRQLRERIATLERELQQQYDKNNTANVVGNQIQIPPSSIHLVINVPKMVVPSSAANLRLDQK